MSIKEIIAVIVLIFVVFGMYGVATYLDYKEMDKCEQKGGVRVKSGSASYTCIAVQKIE